MRAARCQEHGPVDGVVVAEVPEPVVQAGEVLVQVQAAAVNFPDVLVCANRYQVSVPVPFTVGSELAGTVIAVGEGVDESWLGQLVMGSCLFGAFADRVALSLPQVHRAPEGLDAVEAAGFFVTHVTAWQSLVTVADAQPDEWVVVLGASGGVGSAAVAIAARMGCRVIAVASSAPRAALGVSLGAEAGLDHSTQDVKAEIKALTSGGAGVVIDPVGGPLAETSLRAMTYGGRFVTVGYASGDIPRIPLNLVLLKGITVHGMELRSLYAHHPDVEETCTAALAELVRHGLRPHISLVRPFSEVVEALEDVAQRRVQGKVVLDLR